MDSMAEKCFHLCRVRSGNFVTNTLFWEFSKSPRDLIFAACFSHINEQVATFLSIREAFTRP